MSPQPRARAVVVALAIALGLVALVLSWYLVWPFAGKLPARDSPAYRETTRSFYRGLAALEVGLLDDAANRVFPCNRACAGRACELG